MSGIEMFDRQMCGHHNTPLRAPTRRVVPEHLAHIEMGCEACFPELFNDGWDAPAILEHQEINRFDPLVKEIAERLHRNESTHMHIMGGVVCVYCALRAQHAVTVVYAAADGTVPSEPTWKWVS